LLVRLSSLFALVVLAAVLPVSVASAATTNRCPPGQNPLYVSGFASLRAELGDQMGQPVTCEFADPNATGDVHQQTTRGLAFWRKRTNTPTFTNGYDHWALSGGRTVHWTGATIDPPAAALAPPRPPTPAPTAAPTDAALRALVVSAARDLNAFWSTRLPNYTPADLYWYRGSVKTGCGTADSEGPFYCGGDRSVYIETPFFESLWKKGWTFGLQTIMAHEFGHHVQRLSGIRVMPRPVRPGQVYSIEAELGADCLAGVWANDAYSRGTVSKADISEAWDLTSAAGDADGTSWFTPDAHGTARQRTNAFMLGLKNGSPSECLAI
jgi:predicted metalloprotease